MTDLSLTSQHGGSLFGFFLVSNINFLNQNCSYINSPPLCFPLMYFISVFYQNFKREQPEGHNYVYQTGSLTFQKRRVLCQILSSQLVKVLLLGSGIQQPRRNLRVLERPTEGYSAGSCQGLRQEGKWKIEILKTSLAFFFLFCFYSFFSGF